jgi:DNA-binding transcriptional LysR family regulator
VPSNPCNDGFEHLTKEGVSSTRRLARGAAPERSWVLVDQRGVEVSVPVSGNLESDHPIVLLGALRHGLGIRPSREVDLGVAAGDWVRVLPAWGFRPIPVAIVAPRGRLRVRAVRLVAQVLESALRQLSAPDARGSSVA